MKMKKTDRRLYVYRTITVLIFASLVFVPSLPLTRHVASQPTRISPASPFAALPASLLPSINRNLAADNPAYAVTPATATTLQAANPTERLATTFAPEGVTVGRQGTSMWRLALAAVNDEVPATTTPVFADGRVEYRRGDLTEWYVNGPVGLEQGFTLTAPPAADGRVTLALSIAGATPTLSDDAVLLVASDGGTLRYGGLTVTDANGARLPARLDIDGSVLTIIAETAGAAWPVMVDPFVQATGLTASDGTVNDDFGFSVAMSGDGSVVVVGADVKMVNGQGSHGKVYVYSGPGYATETPLLASDGTGGDDFGMSVAISSDGKTVVVGAPPKTVGVRSQQGKAYVYSGAGYATETPLLPSDGAAFEDFGWKVAVSRDGKTVVVGAPAKAVLGHLFQGEAYVYSGPSYASETILTDSDGASGDSFGGSVAVSGDGSTVVVGATTKSVNGHNYQGKAYVCSGAGYTAQTPLLASDGTTGDQFGASVAMSGDGTTVVVGASGKTVNGQGVQGKAYVYRGAGYASETPLTASDGTGGDEFGFSVAVSNDGGAVVVGSTTKSVSGHSNQGKAYVYSGTGYASESPLLASDGAAGDHFGDSVAMSSDGSAVVVGAYGKTVSGHGTQGKAYVFSASLPLPNPLPPHGPSGGSGGISNPLPISPRPNGPVQTGSVNLLPSRRP